MEKGTVFLLIGAVASICSILFTYIGYNKGIKKDSSEAGKNNGTLMSDIGYIKAGVDDLKRKQETAELRHFALVERVTKVEESAKQAHKRIDRIDKVGEE